MENGTTAELLAKGLPGGESAIIRAQRAGCGAGRPRAEARAWPLFPREPATTEQPRMLAAELNALADQRDDEDAMGVARIEDHM